MRSAIAALAGAGLLGGCTHIETHADLTRTDASHALTGMPYSLPMVQYQIATTRTLIACPHPMHDLDGLVTDQGAAVEIYDPGLGVSVTATAKQRYVRGETYVVDYAALSSWLKSTSFGIEVYPTTGTLKSIDVSAEDQTGTVVGDVVKVAVVGAALAAGGPAVGALTAGAAAAVAAPPAAAGGATAKALLEGGHGKPQKTPTKPAAAETALKEILREPGVVISRPIVRCAADTQAAYIAMAGQEKATRMATKAAEDATAKVARATTIAATAGGTREAKDRSVTALADALDAQAKSAAELADEQKKLAAMRASFTSAGAVVFPRVLDEFVRPIPLKGDELAALAARLTVAQVRVIEPEHFAVRFTTLPEKMQKVMLEKYPQIEFYAKWSRPRRDTAAQRAAATALEKCAPASAGDASVIRACLGQLDLTAILGFVEPDGGGGRPSCKAPSSKPASGAPDKFPTLGCRLDVTGSNEAIDARRYDEAAKAAAASPGIFVREPVEGKLYLCLATDAAQCGPAHPELNKISDNPADPPTIAPQLGQLRFLPFRNKAFEKNTLHLDMATDGSITKFGYVRPTAAAATFADTAAAAGKQIQDARTAARDLAAKELKDRQTSDVAALQYQIDLLTKQKSLLEAQDAASSGSPNAAAIADLAAQTALLQGKLARQTASNQLTAAQSAGSQ